MDDKILEVFLIVLNRINIESRKNDISSKSNIEQYIKILLKLLELARGKKVIIDLATIPSNIPTQLFVEMLDFLESNNIKLVQNETKGA